MKSDKEKNISFDKPCSLSVVFSFYNEEDVLNELISRTRTVLGELVSQGILSRFELIFVNDASTDNSLPILLAASKDHDDIRIVTMSRKFGVAPCVVAGMAHASGDAVVYMDTDLQDPPEVIPELLKVWRSDESIDVVHTVRTLRKGESRIKLFITRIGYIILNKLSSVEIPLEAGDFKLLSRRAIDHVLRLGEKGPFIRGLVSWIGFHQKFIPYVREARYAGKTKFRIFSFGVINNFFDSALISFSSVPLKIAFFLGLTTIFLDFIVIGHALLEKLSGNAVPGWTAVMVAILFVGGVQLFSIGIIGLYINSIHEQSKNRPLYIVNNMYGFPNDVNKSVDELVGKPINKSLDKGAQTEAVS